MSSYKSLRLPECRKMTPGDSGSDSGDSGELPERLLPSGGVSGEL